MKLEKAQKLEIPETKMTLWKSKDNYFDSETLLLNYIEEELNKLITNENSLNSTRKVYYYSEILSSLKKYDYLQTFMGENDVFMISKLLYDKDKFIIDDVHFKTNIDYNPLNYESDKYGWVNFYSDGKELKRLYEEFGKRGIEFSEKSHNTKTIKLKF